MDRLTAQGRYGMSGAIVSQPIHKITMRCNVMVPMRDGVRLSTDIYMPDEPGQFPVVLIRTPYNNNREPDTRDAVYFATRGYAVLIQDVRGRGWLRRPKVGGHAALVYRQDRH